LSTYRLGPKSTSDLSEIFGYTLDNWGEHQALNYIDDLARCFQRLADSPGLGRPCAFFPGIRCFEHGKHVIFYKQDRHGILVSRILHQSRLPARPQFMGT
jgi:toxin ParE1/3/4